MIKSYCDGHKNRRDIVDITSRDTLDKIQKERNPHEPDIVEFNSTDFKNISNIEDYLMIWFY